MERQPYQTSSTTSFTELLGRPLRTSGCILLYCTGGRAVVECNFGNRALAKGDIVLIFSDTLFSMKRISPGFSARYFELSVALADEATFTSAGAFFDWLYENPIFRIPDERIHDMELWLTMMDWIESNATGKYRNQMLRNQWQNFFLGLESVLKNRLTENGLKTISSSRKLFDGFCKLLCEHSRRHHDVKFYANRLCITPYYLSHVTHRVFAVSPKDLIDRQIMMEVKSLLTTT